VTNLAWSLALTLLGIGSLLLVPKSPLIGWVVMIVDEVVWIIYSIATRQYPFILSAVAYTTVALINFKRENGRRISSS
jgi:uncharacterized Tic20 family protein